MTIFKFILLGCAGILAANAAEAQQQNSNPDGWEASIGTGLISTPRSLGSQKMRTFVVPSFNVLYKDWFFASPIDGIGVKTSGNNLTFSAAIGMDTNTRDPKAGGRYSELSKINIAPALRLRAAYEYGPFSTEAVISSRLGNATKNGTTLTLEEGYELYAAERTLVTVGVSTRLMNSTFARNLVSISETDSVNSGLPIFAAKSGLLDVGLFAQMIYPINDRWTIFSKVGVNKLEGDAKKSPINERGTSPEVLLFVNYTF